MIGIFAGFIIAVLIFLILAFFRVGIERKIQIIEKKLSDAGPQPRGFIVEPDDDATFARNQLIEKNRREGKDTKLSDLQ